MSYPSVMFPADNPELDFIYTNENPTLYYDAPTFFTLFSVTGYPKNLINDNPNLYYTYSGGWNITTVGKQKQTRYKNLTLRAVSGDTFDFYFTTGDIDSNFSYVSGPVTTSGSYYLLTEHATESGALSNKITFSTPMNSGIFVFPSAKDLSWISLVHSGSAPYKIYQYLPRTFIQVDDLEADVIDVVTLRVSDSIVIGPNLIGDKTILGQKIVDGTLSGVLIADGTVTGSKILANTISGVLITAGTITSTQIATSGITAINIAASAISADNIIGRTITAEKIVLSGITANLLGAEAVTAAALASGSVVSGKVAANAIYGNSIVGGEITGYHVAANTITADKLQVNQLDAVAANMGNLTVNSGISIGVSGYFWAGSGSASAPTNGLKIYTTSGISRLTTYSGGLPQIDIDSAGALTAGSNKEVTLTASGLKFLSGYDGPPNPDSAKYYLGVSALVNNPSIVRWASSINLANSYYAGEKATAGYTAGFYNTNGGWDRCYTVTQAGGVDELFGPGWGYPRSREAYNSLSAYSINNSEVVLFTESQFESSTDAKFSIRSADGSTYLQYTSSPEDSPGRVLFSITEPYPNFNNSTTAINTPKTVISGTLNANQNVQFGTGSNTMIFDSSTGNTTFTGTVTAAGFNVTNGGFDSPLYGTGVHGLVYFDGVNVDYKFASYDSATSTYTLLQDVYGTQIMVSFGITVKTNGFRLFAKSYIEVFGVVQNNGGNASGVTAGAGAPGGYFKAATAGGTGLGTTIAGSVGAVAVQPTSDTLVGGLGGRGAAGRATANTFGGVGPISKANLDVVTPADADGGRFIINNINSWYNRALLTATTLWQMSPSMGGASGSKSTLGASAISGGGGGGGGFVLLASPRIYGFPGTVRALGGNGGNAAGTGGNFGGGGGGGGGVIAVITDPVNYDSTLFDVSGGTGGSSSTSNIIPVAAADSSTTSTTATSVTIYPATSFVKNTIYVLAIHVQGTAGSVPTIDSLSGAGCEWTNMGDLMYSSFSTPTRRLVVFIGKRDWGNESLTTFADDPRIIIKFSNAPISVRYSIDQIQNTRMSQGEWPAYGTAYNITDSATNITTDLGYTPTTNNMVYTVVARSGGTTPVAGTGNTLINNQTVAPLLVSEVSLNRQTNSMSWTTAAAAAAITIDFALPDSSESGISGDNGKVLLFPV
jgi:hypothetical protein